MLIYQPANQSIEVSSAPVELPITVAEVKQHLNIIDNTDDDAFLADCVSAAVDHAEGLLNRAILDQERVLRVSSFPDYFRRALELPGGVVSAVNSVRYFDADGVDTLWAAASYRVGNQSTRGSAILYPAFNEIWPIVEADNPQAVVITYRAGWADAASVPASVKRGLRMMAATFYENREASAPESEMDAMFWRSFVSQWRLGLIA